MWIISNKTMDKLLGGDFSNTLKIRRLCHNLTVRKLFDTQDKYKTYAGFNKFYRKFIKDFNGVYVDNSSWYCKFINGFGKLFGYV